MNNSLAKLGGRILGNKQNSLKLYYLFGQQCELATAAANHASSMECAYQLKFREALNQAIDEEMERDDRVFLIGEEVGHSEGPFKVSKGLMKKYGEGRVIDTPITEMGFTGLSVGAAYDGLRPICEFMNVGFALQSIDHIINSAAKMYYMSAGKFHVPIVFRGPNGIGAGVAAQHSQDFTSWYAQCPGLKVIAPANSEDAKGLLKAAIRDDNPVVFLENELLYGRSFSVDQNVLHNSFALPIGQSKVERTGDAITIVAYSNAVNYSMDAATELAENFGIEAEVINLRTIRPLDFETVANSVRKTRHCITVETGWPFCGVGAEIAARIFEWGLNEHLLAPVMRVTAVDVPTPYNATLEKMSVPAAKDVVEQVKQIFGINEGEDDSV